MRLYVQIYLTVVSVAVLCVASAATLAVALSDGGAGFERDAQDMAEVMVSTLPDPPEARRDRMQQLAERLRGDVALWSADGAVIEATGDVPAGPPGPIRGLRLHGMRVQLSDGRMAGYVVRPNPRRHLRLLVLLALLGTVVAVGTWPVSRRLGRRLEGLRSGATAWGAGDLQVRVPEGGGDEVADVARAFNQAADRVERLVQAQRRVLASASHELRSPLTRLRMTLELLDDDGTDPRVQRAIRDVEELDDTVGDVLDASRMQAQDGPESPEPVQLLDLAQALGDDVTVQGEGYIVSGDRRRLARMLRNLVENARKYGQAPIVVTTTPTGLTVTDGGTAPDEALWEPMFEPFYRPQGHAEGVHGGVGLGLSLVRQIARFHGGDAHLASADGHTQVVVTLPRSP